MSYDDGRASLGEKERDKLLFWFVQAGMWGRFSGSTETFIDQDLAALDGPDGCLDKLLEQLRLWHGGLRVEPGHFTGWKSRRSILSGALGAEAVAVDRAAFTKVRGDVRKLSPDQIWAHRA